VLAVGDTGCTSLRGFLLLRMLANRRVRSLLLVDCEQMPPGCNAYKLQWCATKPACQDSFALGPKHFNTRSAGVEHHASAHAKRALPLVLACCGKGKYVHVHGQQA
jgi:hypothetical protein